MPKEFDVNRRQFVGVTGAALVTGLAKPMTAKVAPPRSEPMSLKDRQFICSDGLHNSVRHGREGYVVKVRLTDYRSLPLSCVVGIILAVDGKSIDSKDITFTLNGYSHKLDQLAGMDKATWWVLDTAELFIPGEKLAPGDHDVEGTLLFIVPYATAGAITLRASSRKRLRLEGEA